MPENKQQQQLKEITEKLEQGVQELFTSEKYMEYLRVMSQFHHYSFSNTLLIAMQKPDATLVAGYGAWQTKFGRNVMRGEKAIKIFAPIPRKKEIQRDVLDPDTLRPVLDENGEPKKETITIQSPTFKITSVFDVSQTDGKPLPELADVQELTASVEGYALLFEALKRTSKVPIAFESIQSGAHGYYHQVEKRIAIDEGMSEAQNVKTAIHEIAHSRLHDVDKEQAEGGQRVDRSTREVQAESVAYTVCQHYGIETSEYSFGYIAGWSSGRDMKELRASMEVIRKEANSMITEIDGHLEELRQEKEQERSVAQNIQNDLGLGGLSRGEVEQTVLAYAQEKLNEMGLGSEVQLLGASVYGSRSREGLYTDESDLDVVISYSGEIREDSFFNALHEQPMELNGITIDINPISLERTGTLETYMEQANSYLDEKEQAQSALVEEVKQPVSPLPVYMQSFSEAKESGEVDCWRASHLETQACARKFNEDFGMAYHERRMPEFLEQMVEQFGMERCKIVLASTIQLADYDGRYYPKTKEEAAKVVIPGENREDSQHDSRMRYRVDCHPVMVNSAFRELVRMEQEQVQSAETVEQDQKADKTSLLGRLHDKQRQVAAEKKNPAKAQDRKRGVEIE
jgi:hypothetical protein